MLPVPPTPVNPARWRDATRSGPGRCARLVGSGRSSPLRRRSGPGEAIIDLIRDTIAKWRHDRVHVLAASVAFYTVFSLAPLLIIVIAVLAFFGRADPQSTIVMQVRGLLGENGAGLVRTMIENRQAGGNNLLATALGLALLLIGATGVFAQLQTALNLIWGVRPDPGRSGLWYLLRVRLLSLGMVLVIGFLLLVSLVLTAAIESLAAALPGSGLPWRLLNWLSSLSVVALLFALIYRVLPDARVPWRAVWLGTLTAALLFVLGKWILGFYLTHQAVASAYGAAGSLVVVMIWAFYSAHVLLLGGEFTQVMAERSRGAIEPAPYAVAEND